MLKILKSKIIFVDWKTKITLNNNIMKIIRGVCKEILLYSQQWLQETDFFNDDGDNDNNGKVPKSCSNDGADVDDVGGNGKRKVDCEDEADEDDDNNKADCDDADGGGGNRNDDGNGDGIFDNWCVDGEGGDEADDGD